MKMTVKIVLGIRLSPNSFQRVTINGIKMSDKVEQLKLEASKATNLPKNFLELIYCGNILDDDAILQSCGVKPGVTVHVLKKKEKDAPAPVRTMSSVEVHELVMAFKTFTRHPSYRSALHRLSRPEVLENMIMSTPGLGDDPVALSIIQDPELLVHMENADTVRRIAELHPSLAEAANHIAAAVHEEAATGSSSAQGTSSGYSYSLDALSDEEEMDSSQSSDSQPRGSGGLTRQHSYTTITAAQLAAALASATNTGSFPVSPRGSSSNASLYTPTGPVISQEMFNQAMQQAIANVSSSASVASNPNDVTTSGNDAPETDSEVQALANRLSRQLQQMHELGLTDDAVNVQALQATGGDLHAAIDIVFSGAVLPESQ